MSTTRSRYSSPFASPSSSSELKSHNKNISYFRRLTGSSNSNRQSPNPSVTEAKSTRILTKTKSPSKALANTKNEGNYGTMVKKLMEKRSKPKSDKDTTTLVMPEGFIAEDLKKNKGSNISSLHRKLFQKAAKKDRSEVKALTEIKSNTRTLAMVLRSERELLSQNKQYESELSELRVMIKDKNREVEKLKDMCLKQREEIKALKNVILFPDDVNPRLHELLEQRGTELKQAKQVIPTLQKQVTSLTGQLRSLAEDLAEVKADKYAVKTCLDGETCSPRTPTLDQEAVNSLEFSCCDFMSPGSPDDMFLKDLNPCLTPQFAKSRSKDYDDSLGYSSPFEDELLWKDCTICQDGEPTKNSECYHNLKMINSSRGSQISNESNYQFGTPTPQKLF